MTRGRPFLLIGAALAGLAIALGAFGAHALEAQVSAARLQTFETAAAYQRYHALALVLVGVLAGVGTGGGRLLHLAGWLFVGGVVLFCGSLYALVLLDAPVLGAITPLGGLSFITGWVSLAVAVSRWRPGAG